LVHSAGRDLRQAVLVVVPRGGKSPGLGRVVPFARKRPRRRTGAGDLLRFSRALGARYPSSVVGGRSGLAADPLLFGAVGNPGGWCVADFLEQSGGRLLVRLSALRRMLTPPEIELLTREVLRSVAQVCASGACRGVWVTPEVQQQFEWAQVMRLWMQEAGSGTFDVPFHFHSVEPALLVAVPGAVAAHVVSGVPGVVGSAVHHLLRAVAVEGKGQARRYVVAEWVPLSLRGLDAWLDAMELLGSSGPLVPDSPRYFERLAGDPPFLGMECRR
jgi:hypothetical protein